MFDYLYERNSGYPNDIAIDYYGHKYTYSDLFYLIDKCCQNLAALGIQKGDVVTIQAMPLPQVIVLLYALTRIGACGNMLYPDSKANDVVASMNKTDSKILFVIDKILELYEKDIPDCFSHTIVLLNVADQMSLIPRIIAKKKAAYKQTNTKLNTITWNEFINKKGQSYSENHDGSLPAFMLRTGGTTGIPKEVVLSSRNFNSVAEGTYYSNIAVWERQKTSLLLQPPFIAFGISSGVHHALAFGITLIVTLDVSPAVISKLMCKYRPNYIIAGTVQIESYMSDMEKKKDTLEYVKLLAVGGEAMSTAFEENLQRFLKERNCPVAHTKGYGLTETSGSILAEMIDVHKTGSVGIPIGLANVRIVDTETGKELSYDEPGEICLSGPSIMQGYYQNQEATDDIIETIDGERWLHTGDVGYMSKDGLLIITGRIKRIIVCKEGILYHKVFPLVLENQLSKVQGVQEITIVGRPDVDKGNLLVAYVVPESQKLSEQIVNNLKAYCDANFESYERPVDYVFMTEFPRTLIGKVNYRALEDMQKDNG